MLWPVARTKREYAGSNVRFFLFLLQTRVVLGTQSYAQMVKHVHKIVLSRPGVWTSKNHSCKGGARGKETQLSHSASCKPPDTRAHTAWQHLAMLWALGLWRRRSMVLTLVPVSCLMERRVKEWYNLWMKTANVGNYLLEDDSHYKMFKLVNKEFTFTADVSQVRKSLLSYENNLV